MTKRKLQIVVGTQLRARVDFWSPGSPVFIEGLDALMVSFGEIVTRAAAMKGAAAIGLKDYLGFRGNIFLDNGCFTLLRNGQKPNIEKYVRFVQSAKPDWFPIPVDYLPLPSSSKRAARVLAEKTATINERFCVAGYVPVVHMGPHFPYYFEKTVRELAPKRIAVGGMVPYLRFTRGATPRLAVEYLARARKSFDGSLHVFGFGGGITSLHLAAALQIDSVDSSGWRVCAAKGLILIPGSGQRLIRRFGECNGRELSYEEKLILSRCRCAVCSCAPRRMLSKSGGVGFQNRAVHNLWVLSREAALLNACPTHALKAWSLTRLRQNRMRYLVEHAFDVTSTRH